jgi:hypothetical protein
MYRMVEVGGRFFGISCFGLFCSWPPTTTLPLCAWLPLTFCLQDDVEVKLMMGDELRLRHRCPSGRPAWEGSGHVTLTGGSSEEVGGCQSRAA